MRVLLPPPPADPRCLGLGQSVAKTIDLCRIVRELCDLVKQQSRDIQALRVEVAALRAEASTVQDGKSAFISRLTRAAHGWEANMAPSHESEEEEQGEDEEEYFQAEATAGQHPEEQYEEDWEEQRLKRLRLI